MHRDPLSPPSNARVALSTGADGGCESIVPTLHLCGVLGLKQELSAAEGERYAVRPGIGHAEGGGAADAHLPSRRTVAPLTVPLDAMRSEHNPAPSPVFEDGRTDRLLRQPTLQQRHNWRRRRSRGLRVRDGLNRKLRVGNGLDRRLRVRNGGHDRRGDDGLSHRLHWLNYLNHRRRRRRRRGADHRCPSDRRPSDRRSHSSPSKSGMMVVMVRMMVVKVRMCCVVVHFSAVVVRLCFHSVDHCSCHIAVCQRSHRSPLLAVLQPLLPPLDSAVMPSHGPSVGVW